VTADSSGPDERLAGLFPGEGMPRVVAEIWATVDLDRSLAAEGLPSERLPDDELLGARVALVRPPARHPIAVLEPATEGRLAAVLARNGEGPAGHYVEARRALEPLGDRGAGGLGVSRIASGPFGREVLVDGPIAGPLLVVVEPPAGTIER
jgi:hypothetical protein